MSAAAPFLVVILDGDARDWDAGVIYAADTEAEAEARARELLEAETPDAEERARGDYVVRVVVFRLVAEYEGTYPPAPPAPGPYIVARRPPLEGGA